jgi:hypothetical protein
MYPHRINLRGPWQCEPFDSSVRPSRVTMPCRWADTPLAGFAGRIRCQRRFHWQQPLNENERLFLVIGAADDHAAVTLNGHLLGKHDGTFDPFEFEITALVQTSNDLCIDVDSTGKSHGLWGTVFLEVRREHYLQDVAVTIPWTNGVPYLEISGKVIGPSDQRCDLDVVLTERLLVSQAVTASPTGKPFSFAVKLPEIVPWQPNGYGSPVLHELRLELLDVHSRLFVQAQRLGLREACLLPEQEQVMVNGHLCWLPEPWPLQEPLLESPTLDQADAEGRLMVVALPELPDVAPEEKARQYKVMRRYLAMHPAVVRILPS